MILYLDTSALLKLYVAEEGATDIRQSVSAATVACTHLIAYTELHAALALATRMGRISEEERAYQARRFDSDWSALHVIAVDEPLVRRAAEHAGQHGLRGYDSIHLAAAERAFDGAGRPGSFGFAAFDQSLRTGAHHLGIPIRP